jgi:hypothetical protein
VRKNQMSALTVEEKSDVEVAEKTEPPPNAPNDFFRDNILDSLGNKDKAMRVWGVDSSILHCFCRGILGDSFCISDCQKG